jgi:ABC-type uncharacterized transport system substrate-binding protein
MSVRRHPRWRLGAAAVALAVMSSPLTAGSQPASKPVRIGVLCLFTCEGPGIVAFRAALRDLGYVERRTLAFEYRDAAGRTDRLAPLADELVRGKVDLIFTPRGTAAALAAKSATATIPVVIGAVGDPVKAGIVPSLAHPGGNVTGVSSLMVHGYVATQRNRGSIIRFAAANRLPAVYAAREDVDEGGLLSYGANVVDISRRAAHYVDRILKGARPADLPVEQATTVELVVNRKTAAALGLAVPSTLLLRADHIID